jgi:hypothetical protein
MELALIGDVSRHLELLDQRVRQASSNMEVDRIGMALSTLCNIHNVDLLTEIHIFPNSLSKVVNPSSF